MRIQPTVRSGRVKLAGADRSKWMARAPYTALAYQHAEAIVADEITAGKWLRPACQRQLDNLEKYKGKNSPYRLNPKLGDTAGTGWTGLSLRRSNYDLKPVKGRDDLQRLTKP